MRPCAVEDLQSVAAIANSRAGFRAVSEATVAHWLGRFGSDPERDFVVVVAPGERLAGYLRIFADPPFDEPIFMAGSGLDRRGLGTWLCRCAEARGAQMSRGAHGPVELLARVPEGCSSGASLLAARGYREARHLDLLVADSGELLHALGRSPDVKVTLERGRELEVYEILRESFRDHWGTSWPAYEAWRPEAGEAMFVAWRERRMIGALLVGSQTVEDPYCAQFIELGVPLEHRRDGVARALLRHGAKYALELDRERVGLFMDSESTTGARQLFYGLGFRSSPRFTYWSKRLR